jgi:hypothetical protein
MRIDRLTGLLIFFAAVAVPAARADTFTFTPTDGDPAYSFTIADNTAPNGTIFSYFFSENVVDSNGQDISVYFDATDGVEEKYDFSLSVAGAPKSYDEDGIPLFSGPTTSPNFIEGTYDLTVDPVYAVAGSTVIDSGGVLTITADASPVPEPSSVALLGTGILGIIGIRRRNTL